MADLSIVALAVAGAGMAFSIGQAFNTLRSRLVRHSDGPQVMQLVVDGEAITINIGELEREDARNIEYAVEAVRAAKLRDRTPVTA